MPALVDLVLRNPTCCILRIEPMCSLYTQYTYNLLLLDKGIELLAYANRFVKL